MLLNAYQLFAITSAAVGSGFQHGYNLGVINAPQKLIQNFINETYRHRNGVDLSEPHAKLLVSTSVAVLCLGGMVGAIVSSFIAHKLGPKLGLLCNNIFVFIAAALEGFSKTAKLYEMLIVGRFIIGINSGINAALAPMYLTEISPVNVRGAVGSVYQLTITITILLSQILGMPSVLGTEERWPILFGLIIIPSIFMLVAFPFCPESPKYLVSKKDEESAEKALKWLLNTEGIQTEFDDIREEVEEEESLPKVNVKELFMNKMLRRPLVISVVVMISQQFSGINFAIFYSTSIFKDAGLKEDDAVKATIGMGVLNVLTTVVALVLVEVLGRKSLHLIGMSGMAVLSIILTITMGLKNTASGVEYISVACVIAFVVFFAIGPGPIPWFLVAEITTQSARPLITSIAVCVNWFATFIVSFAFLPLADVMNNYVFLIFTACLVVCCLYTYLQVPETKDRTIEEITREFRSKK